MPYQPGTYALSRFAVVRTHDDGLVLESPLVAGRLPLSAGVLALVHRLAAPTDLDALMGSLPDGSRGPAADAIGLLQEQGFLTAVGDGGRADEAGALRTWEFHDLLFHARSRAGRALQAVGGTYRFGDGPNPTPLETAPDPDPAAIALPDADGRATLPLADALARRLSRREYGPGPLPLADLGALLALSCRAERRGGRWRRPYPSGGATYALRVYPVVRACDGLAAGAYRYDPVGHALVPVEAEAEGLERLFEGAARAAGQARPAPVLLALSARFGRTAWKYQGIAYSLVLKEVGGLYQTLWLAATALGLGGCGLGSGDSDVFADALGLDYYAETSVGEFVVGP